MPKQEIFDRFDIEELAAHLCGLPEDGDYDTHEIDEKLAEKYEISLDHFCEIVQDLGELIDLGISPLTEEIFIGFGTGNMWIAKKKYPKFINQVLIWMDYEAVKNGKGQAYERDITSGGKPEFKLVLMKAEQDWTFKEPEASNAPKGLIGHPADELPPIAEDEISKQFQQSDTFPAWVIDLESGHEIFDLVYYCYRRNHWMHSREGLKIKVLEWYSRKEASHV